MKKIQGLSVLATLAIAIGLISWAGTLNAQTAPATPSAPTTQPSDTPQTQPPSTAPTPAPTPDASAPSNTAPTSTQSPSTQSPSTPNTPDQASPSAPSTPTTPPSSAAPSTSSPDSSATAGSAAGANGAQVFAGTVEKQGDKYVLKDDSGKTYDIDHQSDVAKFEGKRGRVQGTLDPAPNKIMVTYASPFITRVRS